MSLSAKSCKYLMGWQLHHFPGQPAPVPNLHFHEEILPDEQSKPPLPQPEAVSLCPITSHLRKETDTLPAAAFSQVAVESHEASFSQD